MNSKHKLNGVAGALAALVALPAFASSPDGPSADELAWRLPAVSHPAGNESTPARVELGRTLFFDPKLSGTGEMSCASCHDPSKGWTDGLPLARGEGGKTLSRRTPTIVNAAYASIFMWDGRAPSLEAQALGPMENPNEMHADVDNVLRYLETNPAYNKAFAKAYPNEPISRATLGKAIAAFERTVIVDQTPFDRWLGGDKSAMTAQQVRGFRVFTNPDKGNCAVCHQAPTFSDNGFHNIGLMSQEDPGRFAIKPVKVNRGAFKTPALRNIGASPPYFHDGSAATLPVVVEHYVNGGAVTTNLSPNMKRLTLTAQEKADLIAFLNALTEPQKRPSNLQTAGEGKGGLP